MRSGSSPFWHCLASSLSLINNEIGRSIPLHVSFMDRYLFGTDPCNYYQVQTLQHVRAVALQAIVDSHPTPAAAWQ